LLAKSEGLTCMARETRERRVDEVRLSQPQLSNLRDAGIRH
jgi:hypothetical protein